MSIDENEKLSIRVERLESWQLEEEAKNKRNKEILRQVAERLAIFREEIAKIIADRQADKID